MTNTYSEKKEKFTFSMQSYIRIDGKGKVENKLVGQLGFVTSLVYVYV